MRNPKKFRLYLVGALTLLLSGFLLAYSLLPAHKPFREGKGIIPILKRGQMSLFEKEFFSKSEIGSEGVFAAVGELAKQVER